MPVVDTSPASYICPTSGKALADYTAKFGAEKASSMMAIFQGCNQLGSFAKQSYNFGQQWSGVQKFGCGAGFALFGIMYLFTIVRIVLDIFKRQAMYEKMVEEDKQSLNDLGIDVNSLAADLHKRLTETGVEENADDQLIGEAAKLQQGQF